MTKEVQYQTKIVKAITDQGGFAMKMSHRFLVGVPDLLIKVSPQHLTLVLECKRVVVTAKKATHALVKITPLQFQTLEKMAKAGFVTGVAAIVAEKDMVGFAILSHMLFSRQNDHRVMLALDEMEFFRPVDFPMGVCSYVERWSA